MCQVDMKLSNMACGVYLRYYSRNKLAEESLSYSADLSSPVLCAFVFNSVTKVILKAYGMLLVHKRSKCSVKVFSRCQAVYTLVVI